MEISEIYDFITLMRVTYGDFVLVAIAVLLVGAFVFKERIKSFVTEPTHKLIEVYRKIVAISFRDEEVRANVAAAALIASNEKRLQIFDEIYKLFFDVLNSIASIREEVANDAKPTSDRLLAKLTEAKQLVHRNWVYTGKLTDYLLNAVIALTNDVRSGASSRPGAEGLQTVLDASAELTKAEQWICQNMSTQHTVKNYELDEAALKAIETRRNQIIGEIKNK